MVIYANVSTIFAAAVDDELILKNPCRASSVSRPRPRNRKVVPWSADRVRQVKVFGGNRLVFALPKGRKTRTVPLPESVRDAIAVHLTRHPARSVTLPWEALTGDERTVPLLLSTRERSALNRNYFNTKIWKPALVKAGVEPTRENGTHALRHFYASTLLDAGESIKALSEYLGQADPSFTLRTDTHLMPTSDERTRRAVDQVFCVTGVHPLGTEGAKAQVRGR